MSGPVKGTTAQDFIAEQTKALKKEYPIREDSQSMVPKGLNVIGHTMTAEENRALAVIARKQGLIAKNDTVSCSRFGDDPMGIKGASDLERAAREAGIIGSGEHLECVPVLGRDDKI